MRFWVLAGLASLAVVGCSWFGGDTPKAGLVVHPGAKTREFTFTYVARVKEVPAGAKRLELWLPIPPSTPAQEVKAMRFSPVMPEIGTDDEFGNQIAYFVLEGADLKPVSVTAEYDVLVAERLADDRGSAFQDEPTERDLAGDRLAPVGGESSAIAAALTSGNLAPLDAGERLYRGVLEKMRYSKEGEGWGQGSTEWACRAGYGNCTDFHALFIAMARSREIPARFTMGFPLPDARGEEEVKGYHCWAEFWVEGIGWVPVDASEADKMLARNEPKWADYYFGSLTENRVAFSRGRDITLAPAQAGPPLNFFIYPYAEVDGAAWSGVERSFRFKDR